MENRTGKIELYGPEQGSRGIKNLAEANPKIVAKIKKIMEEALHFRLKNNKSVI